MKKVLLGQKVKDVVTGFTGIAVAQTFQKNSVTRISVQPPMSADGKVPDAFDFDECQLQVLDETRVIEIEPNQVLFQFGDEAVHTNSGFKGKVARFATYLNGCIHIALQRKVDEKEGFLPDAKWFSQEDLELTKPIETKKPVEKKQTGGPMTRSEKVW